MTNEQTKVENKHKVSQWMNTLTRVSPNGLRQALSEIYHPHAQWNGSHPLNENQGVEAIESVFWQPMRQALPDVERWDHLLLAGNYKGNDLVGAVGHLVGTFQNDWLDIPATQGVVYVRYGEYHQIVDGKIATSHVLIDFLDLMRQAGFWPMAPSLGREGRWPGPATQDGVLLHAQDPKRSQKSLELVLSMHQGLVSYDGSPPDRKGLDSMNQVHFWHPNMMWYGPSGIGTTRGLAGFEQYHQVPFLIAFPDRGGIDHYAEIADGDYVGTGGWPSLTATHLGGNWLGLSPTGRPVKMRVMDFYRCEGSFIKENWVPIDIIDVLMQFDVDVFARMRQQFPRKKS